jgi:hypothetical protein
MASVIKHLHIHVKKDLILPSYKYWYFKEVPNYFRVIYDTTKIVYKVCFKIDDDDFIMECNSVKCNFLKELCKIHKKYRFLRGSKLLIMNMGNYESSILSFKFWNYGASDDDDEHEPLDEFGIFDEEDENIMGIIVTNLYESGDDYGRGLPGVSKVTYNFETKSFKSENQIIDKYKIFINEKN